MSGPAQLELGAFRAAGLVRGGHLHRGIDALLLVDCQREVEGVVQQTGLDAELAQLGGIEGAVVGQIGGAEVGALAGDYRRLAGKRDVGEEAADAVAQAGRP